MVGLGVVGLGLGLLALAWGHFGWPARELVRGHLGDVAIMMFLVAVLGLLLPRAPRWLWFVVPASFGLVTEVGQALGLRGEGLIGELTIGSTFDPYDLLAYAIGLAIAAGALYRR